MNYYPKTAEAFEELKKAYQEKGYSFEKEENSAYISGKIHVEHVAKCEYCDQYINYAACKAHGRTCEHCGKIVHLDVIDGDLIRFNFLDDTSFFDIILRYHSWNQEKKEVYFYTEIPEKKNNVELAKKKMEHFKDSYQLKEIENVPVYAFYYDLRAFRLDENAKISFCETMGGFDKVKLLRRYNEKDYGEFDSLPVPERITIYRDWLIQKDAKEIVRRNGMITKPSYYSGRGVNRSDLSEKHLKQIYSSIGEHIGESAASNFIKMVKALPVLSATNFLIHLFRLERNQWVWDSYLLDKNNNGIDIDGLGSALGTIASRITTNQELNIYESQEMLFSFLQMIGQEEEFEEYFIF